MAIRTISSGGNTSQRMTFLPFSSHVSSYSLPPGVSVASNDAYVSGTSSTGLEPCITSDTSRKVTVNYSSYSITANAPVIAFATTGGPTSSSGSVTITLAENSASYPYGFFKGIVNVPESDGSYIIPVSLISGSSVTISGDYLKSTGTQRGIIIPLRIRKCTITYNANGGSVSPSSESVRYGSSVTLPTPTRDHYAFNGWYTAATGGSYVGQGGDTYTPGSSITLHSARFHSMPTAEQALRLRCMQRRVVRGLAHLACQQRPIPFSQDGQHHRRRHTSRSRISLACHIRVRPQI